MNPPKLTECDQTSFLFFLNSVKRRKVISGLRVSHATNNELEKAFYTPISCTEALAEAKQWRYGPNDDQFEDPGGPQLCPGPDVLVRDELNQSYLPIHFLPIL